MPTPDRFEAKPLAKDRDQLQRATLGEKNKVLDRPILLMPVHAIAVSSFVVAQDNSRQGPPSAVTLWSSDELGQTLTIADTLMQRCFGIKLRVDSTRWIDLKEHDASLANFPIAEPRNDIGYAQQLHQSFTALAGRSLPPQNGRQAESIIQALFVNQLYPSWIETEKAYQTSSTVGLALRAVSTDADAMSNRVVVGYLPDKRKPRGHKQSRLTTWVPKFHAHPGLAALVLAHEFGHMLGVQHNDASVGGRSNLMEPSIDNPPPEEYHKIQPENFALDPEDAELARSSGLDKGLLLKL